MDDMKIQSKYEILTPDGYKDFHGVRKLYKDHYYHIKYDKLELKCSGDHKIDTPDGYVYAKDLIIGDILLTDYGTSVINNIDIIHENIELFDLIQVEDHRHRFYANHTIVSNCAFIDNDLWGEFYASVYPTISSGRNTKIILVSTANGMNHYHKLWNDAIKGVSTFSSFEVTWRSVPDRDDEWRKETIGNTSEEKFAQEHENHFLGSSNTLISSTDLNNMFAETPLNSNENLSIYDNPISDHKYFISVDCGQGLLLDYSIINVFDITTYPIVQVAVYRDNKISPMFLPSVILDIATKYNKAWTLIESNDIGSQIVTDFNFDLEYENIMSIRTTNENARYRLGMRTTKKTKSLGCSVFKELMRDQKLILKDQNTINEISTFVKKGNSYEAETSKHDDIVMTIVNMAYASTTEQFKEITNINISQLLIDNRNREIEDNLLPAPIIDDGVNNTFNMIDTNEYTEYDINDPTMKGF